MRRGGSLSPISHLKLQNDDLGGHQRYRSSVDVYRGNSDYYSQDYVPSHYPSKPELQL